MSTVQSTQALPASVVATQPDIVDVWSRTDDQYRVRAVLLLCVNIVLFAGLGCFAYWLRSGAHFAPLAEGYAHRMAQTFRPWADQGVPLSSLLTYPIDQDDVPMQIPIHGLLLAALVAVPILIAILYRLPACIPFLLIVAFLAVMPWLALTLLLSCVVATWRPLRFNFRYASAMLGLVPFIGYIFSASRQSPGAIERVAAPTDQFRFMAPWILAVVAAALLMGLALLIARTVNYRPGAIAPLLAIMFLTPGFLFEFHVGRDELYYRILEGEYGPASAYFREHDLTQAPDDGAGHETPPPPAPAPMNEPRRGEWRRHVEEWFARRQARVIDACDAFILNFPESRYHPNVLYIKALALDTRIDGPALRQDHRLRCYHVDNEFPSEASRETWMTLLINRPASPLAAMAGLRLSQMDARQCATAPALDRLAEVIRRFAVRTENAAAVDPASAATPSASSPLDRRPPEANLNVPVEYAVQTARRLRDLLASNRGDPRYGDRMFCGAADSAEADVPGLLLFNPYDAHYGPNLTALLGRYRETPLVDNLELLTARRAPTIDERISAFESILTRFADGDSVPETLYLLAEAYKQGGRIDEARQTLQRLRGQYPQSTWAPLADERLRVLPAGTAGGK